MKLFWFMTILMVTIMLISNYSNTIFWYTLWQYIFVNQAYNVLWTFIIIGMFIFILRINKFIKINNRTTICIAKNMKNFIRYDLINFIEEHKYFTEITADINKIFLQLIFILYLIAIPFYLLTIYSIHHKKKENLTKLFSLFY